MRLYTGAITEATLLTDMEAADTRWTSNTRNLHRIRVYRIVTRVVYKMSHGSRMRLTLGRYRVVCVRTRIHSHLTPSPDLIVNLTGITAQIRNGGTTTNVAFLGGSVKGPTNQSTRLESKWSSDSIQIVLTRTGEFGWENLTDGNLTTFGHGTGSNRTLSVGETGELWCEV